VDAALMRGPLRTGVPSGVSPPYEPPRVERVPEAAELVDEILYAGFDIPIDGGGGGGNN